MPNLPPFPRLRRPIAVGASVAPDALEVAEPKVVEAAGLRWIHVENPRLGLPAAAHPDRVDLRMNVPVPGENEPFSFWIVVALMAIMLVFLTILFRRRGWL